MKFDKGNLKYTIRENRDKHRSEYEEAMTGYEEKAIETLSAYLAALKAGKRPHVVMHMTLPQDHTKDYDRVLAMLEMSVDTCIELDEEAFAQYVQDDWGWKGQFIATNAMYKKG